MSEYLEMPWSVEDTIQNLLELKEGLKEAAISVNLHGKGKQDAEEIEYDFDRAIKALEDVQRYREIGTVEECRVAVEKRKPKKPSESRCSEKTHYRCPNCGYIPLTVYANGYRLGNKPDFCEKCGKAIDWSDI